MCCASRLKTMKKKSSNNILTGLMILLCISLFATACAKEKKPENVTAEPENDVVTETEDIEENEKQPEPEAKPEAEKEQEPEAEAEAEMEAEPEGFDISSLKAAADHDQLIICEAVGTEADYTMYEKNASGEWDIILETHGYVGREDHGGR